MNEEDIKIIVGGPAGSGAMSLGISIGRAIKRHGWYVYVYDDHPSLIKGGHNMVHIRASKDKIHSQRKGADILIALDKLSIERHIDEIFEGGIVIYNSTIDKSIPKRDDITYVSVNFARILNELGHIKYYNMVALGVVARVLNMNKKVVENVIKDTFKSKGKDVVSENVKAMIYGYNEVKNVKYSKEIELIKEDKERLFMNGNESATIGAIKSGVKFVGMYPMTPTSPILTYMSKYEKNKRIIVKQTEDEIAAINSAIGASFSGVRSLVATSGGGFSLMVEALGMAGMMELPIVVIEGQRASPSTGMPTYTEQGDLRFVLHASQGEFPRVVVSPGDVEETFYVVFDAFNIADRLQVPVIVLMDKHLCSVHETIERFNTKLLKINRGKFLTKEEAEKIKEYKRYDTKMDDGISYRTIPSYPNTMYVSSSYEHDDTGFTTEDAEIRKKQMEKRMKKLDYLDREIYRIRVYETSNPQINLVCWGSTKMACMEAQKMLLNEGIGSRVLHYLYLHPFPYEDSMKYLSELPSLLVELNYTGQLSGLIREHTGIEIKHKYLKYDGRPFYPEDIVERVKEILR